MWTGTISFGMVAIPVKLYLAAEDKEVPLKRNIHRLHRECQTRMQKPQWCPTCQRALKTADTQRVYEVAKGKYVPIEEADEAKLPLPTLRSIEVVETVDASGMDPRCPRKGYIAAPDEDMAGGAKAFALFRKAAETTGLCVVVKVAMGDREEIALMRPFQDKLLLQTLFYVDELRDPGQIPTTPQPVVTEREVAMAVQLFKAMKVDTLDLSKFQDAYRLAFQALIEAKVAGRELATAETAAPTGDAALESSLMASIEAFLKRPKVSA